MTRKQTGKRGGGGTGDRQAREARQARQPRRRATPAPRQANEAARASRAGQPEQADDDFGYRGKRLGLPEDGSNSLGSTGRRLIALLVDWLLCYVIAFAFIGHGDLNATGTNMGTLAVFAAENLLLVSTLGFTVGKRLLGLRVVSVTQPHLTPLAVIVRTVLLCLVLPAAVYDRDGRGFHDKAVGTAVVQA